MRQIGTFTDKLLAMDICNELRDRGIASETTMQWQGSYSIQSQALVWVEENAPNGVIASVVQEMTAKREARPEHRAAVVDEELRCRQCGYDLRGQRESGGCPECGHAYQLTGSFKCGGCGEEVPGDFAVCWNCGKEFEKQEGDEEAEK